MFLFLITCSLSFIVFYNSIELKQELPSWACEVRLLTLWFWKDLPFVPIVKGVKTILSGVILSYIITRMSPKKESVSTSEMAPEMLSVLNLPDLVLESILEKLPPEGLCRMASVCTDLRDLCTSDHLWERHLKNKWGKVVGPAAYREWKCHVASTKGEILFNQGREKGLVDYLSHLWPFSLMRCNNNGIKNFSPVGSIMSWYLALESGYIWFPAQVYNRENGHLGFMLSCYDAELCYDRQTNTFQARYPPHGRRACTIETGVTWDRLRSPPFDVSPHDLHISACLNELQPGDQIEIQWRRNKQYPYGWWYGVVGHLESCDENMSYCRCHTKDTLVLEFKQYTRGSRWRTTTVSRKDHREEGNEADGFYGGIRKLSGSEEITKWKKLWPAHVLE